MTSVDVALTFSGHGGDGLIQQDEHSGLFQP